MADPARYHLDPLLDNNEAKLHVERSGSGDWVKWADFVDYKAAQRRNKAADSITQMGIEIAELRSQLVDVAAEKASNNAEFCEMKQDYLQIRIKNAALAAENERLKQPWVKILTESETWNALSEVARLTAENERLRKAVSYIDGQANTYKLTDFRAKEGGSK